MHAQIKNLISLQTCDGKLLTVKRQLEKIPRDIESAKENLRSDEQNVQAAKEKIKHCEVEIKKIELDIATRNNTIQRLKVQQFETRKNDEFTALGNEIIRYGKEIDQLETQQLELLEQLDAQRSKLNDEENKLSKSKALVDEDITDLLLKQKEQETKLATLEQERKALAAPCDSSTLSLYEKLLKIKSGIAIAEIHNHLCGGCHMKLVASTVIRASAGQEITQCENCGRILFTN